MDMDAAKLAAAQRILGARTETELVDRALDRVSSIVAMELRAGEYNDAQAAGVEDFDRPYADRERIIVPTLDVFVQTGRVLSALALTS